MGFLLYIYIRNWFVIPAFVTFGLATRGNYTHKLLWPFAKKTLDTLELDTWPYTHNSWGLITLANIYLSIRFLY